MTIEAGTIGLAEGQIARLSVVNHDHSSGVDNGDTANIPKDPCILEIRSIEGVLLASLRVEHLAAETGAYVDYPFQGHCGQRTEIYGLMRHRSGEKHAHGATLQIFDAGTGTTRATLVPCIFPDPELR